MVFIILCLALLNINLYQKKNIQWNSLKCDNLLACPKHGYQISRERKSHSLPIDTV